MQTIITACLALAPVLLGSSIKRTLDKWSDVEVGDLAAFLKFAGLYLFVVLVFIGGCLSTIHYLLPR